MATAEVPVLQTVSSQDLARELHSEQGPVFLLDCRTVLSYNSCHISGAAKIGVVQAHRTSSNLHEPHHHRASKVCRVLMH